MLTETVNCNSEKQIFDLLVQLRMLCVGFVSSFPFFITVNDAIEMNTYCKRSDFNQLIFLLGTNNMREKNGFSPY